MARSLWEGSISFGLVEIPVGLYPAENTDELSFKLLDKRDLSPVGYKRVNKNSGKEVPWDDIVRGYEYEKGEFVLVADEELKAANPRATQTVDILGFVDDGAIDVMYFDRPYYLAPGKRGGKSYALLRDTLVRTKKIGVAHVVIRTRQHLAALMPRGPILVLELLRYDDELRKPQDLDLPVDLLQKTKASEAELRLAERLVTEMKAKWQPADYHDDYRDDLLKLIDEKVKAGDPRAVIAPPKEKGARGHGKVVDLMALLKQSVGEAGAKGARRAGANGAASGRTRSSARAAGHARETSAPRATRSAPHRAGPRAARSHASRGERRRRAGGA